jgi:inosine-uridine nucleoside N-ribohydrolase
MVRIASILLLLTAPVTAYGQERQQQPRPILLATDIGADMDDQWVLAHLVLSTEFDLRGVVTTHTGSYPVLRAPAAESSTRVAEDVLNHLPLTKRPRVIAGSSDPLRSKTEPRRGQGVDFIVSESRGYDRARPLRIVVIGAATDVASALLVDPSLAKRIEIVAMAFRNWPEGGDEFNVKNDMKAWQVLLESPAPIVVSDGAVALADLRMTRESARREFEERGKPGGYLSCLLVDWLERRGEMAQIVTGDRNSWPVWDEGTVAYLLGLTKSEVHPRPRLGDDMKFEQPPAGESSASTVTWVTSIDSEKLWSDFGRKLDKSLAEQETK